MSKRYYIAYGSNLSVKQMAQRCPTAKIVGKAELKDWALVFKVCATIEPRKGSVVPVLVWEIQPEDEKHLDAYEGFPSFYYKKMLDVDVTPLKGGKTEKLNAMVYVMDEKRRAAPPSSYYYHVLEEGYTRFGFDKAILRAAILDIIARGGDPE